MKRSALRLMLLVLVLFELYFATAYLPFRWQSAIDRALAHTLLRQEAVRLTSHPALDEEIQSALRENLLAAVMVYACLTAVLLLNAFGILKTWNALGRAGTVNTGSSKH